MNLSASERGELAVLQCSHTAAVAQVRRARLILLLDEGASWSTIKQELGCDSRFIATWSSRFIEQRLAGLFARHPGRAPLRDPAKLEARVLDQTLKHKPRDGSTHWSSRKLAAELKLPFMTVQRIWRKHNVQPHRVQRHMISNDPDFEAKAADVIGLYLNPPAHAAVFCVDEKTAIQVLGQTAPRHTSAQFVAFLADIVASQRPGKAIHVICDNVSAHKTQTVQAFVAGHPSVAIHYTPTYSSWLNQVENWFARIQRDVIARGVFTSTKDLHKKLMRYIRQYNKNAKPLKWKYDNPANRIRCNSSGSVD